MNDPADLFSLARSFSQEDPDPVSRAELEALAERAAGGDAAAVEALRDRFSAPLEFGTAGLRGRVEAGLARMNRVTVAKAAYALGTHLLSSPERGVAERGVVVGFDGRRSSRQFAEETAAVLAGLGIPVHLFRDPTPTPVVAFAVPHLGGAAGVVVTASHNPPADNGMKVYRADGSQILSPEDSAIARRLREAPRYDQLPRLAPPDAAAAGRRRPVDDAVEVAYREGLARGSWHRVEGLPLRIVYTAMHGVGHGTALRALETAGFCGVAVVASQADPDGAFPTVAFPNPEEPGALDLALALASEIDADLVLANDPDADRLAAAAMGPSGLRVLSGNEVGVLLADDALEHAPTNGRRPLVATTIVSSTLLARMARDRGAAYAETLTGFKWIADAARRTAVDEAFVFGYEEALGYTVGTLVADKDGIGAALHLAQLARHLKARGVTLVERLDELLLAHGMSHQTQWSVTLGGASASPRVEDVMKELRASPLVEIDGGPVDRVVDYETGEERLTTGEVRRIEMPRSNVLAFHAASGRLVVRPSGTEPKIKFYLELVARVANSAQVREARIRLAARGLAMKAALLERLALGSPPAGPREGPAGDFGGCEP